MTDGTTPNPSSPNQPSDDTASVNELDALLDQASAMVDEVRVALEGDTPELKTYDPAGDLPAASESTQPVTDNSETIEHEATSPEASAPGEQPAAYPTNDPDSPVDETHSQPSDEPADLAGNDPSQEESAATEEPSGINTGLDIQLSELDSLLEETQRELGDEDEVSEPDVDPPVSVVPDFMAEFTEPPDDSNADAISKPSVTEEGSDKQNETIAQSEYAPSDSIDEIPSFGDVVAEAASVESAEESVPPDSQEPTAKAADIASQDATPPEPAEADSTPAEPPLPEPTPQPKATAKMGVVKSSDGDPVPEDSPEDDASTDTVKVGILTRFGLSVPIDKASRTALKACDRLVAVLERVDRPTERLGSGGRKLVGLAGFATLGTAAIVYLISMF